MRSNCLYDIGYYNDYYLLIRSILLLFQQQQMQSRVSELEGQGQRNGQGRPELSSAQILAAMKKKPYTQLIHGAEYTYSILSKRQQNFVLTNERFLVLKGIESISYARSFPQNRTLPFANAAQLPNFKYSFRVAEIESFTNEQQRLIIQFSGKNKVKWQFVCPTKVCALEWRKKLDRATQTLADFQQSRFNKFEEYLEHKRKQEALKISQFSQMKSLMGSAVTYSEPSLYNESQSAIRANDIHGSRAQHSQISINPPSPQPIKKQEMPSVTLINNNQKPIVSPPLNEIEKPKEANISAVVVEEKQKDDNLLALITSLGKQPNPSTEQKSNDKDKQLKPFVNYIEATINKQEKKIDRPTAVLFKGSQIAKVQNFIIQNRTEQELLDRSMMSIPLDEKQNMKLQIAKLRRDWIQQLLGGEEEGQIIIDFRNYVRKVAEVIVNELYVPQEHKIYPVQSQSSLYASYLLDDVEVQIYFYSEEYLINKNPRYKAAALQFKNFDYLLGSLRNQTVLKVPLMVLFEYKGFLGMAKSRIGDSTAFRNKELYEIIDRQQFERATRVSASVLLNQSKCKIIAYEKRTSLSKMVAQDRQFFFTEYLTEFLPIEDVQRKGSLLRPQFLQDEELEEDIFRDEVIPVREERINSLIQRKISYLVKVLEIGEDYFTTSKELSELIHYHGLNIHHIGAIYKMVKQNWLKKILQAEMASRCAKNFFRLDIQNSVLANVDKLSKKQKQEYRERNRVISFLNIVFGNTETTFRLWRSFNNSALQSYGVNIWENEFTDINQPYFLQAIQSNFKIILADTIHEKKLFKSMNTFQPHDFIRFQFDTTIYDLEFTDIFDQIHECLQEKTLDSFHDLCHILIGQTSNHVPYLELLKNHPIHDKINQFLLNFASPEENQELYQRIEAKNFPSRFTYESKLAEIKWHLKSGHHEATYKPAYFIEEHAKKWLGNVHPLFTQLNHIFAEYFAQFQSFYAKAIKHTQASLQMQQMLFDGEGQALWKDYFLLAKIHYQNGKLDDALKYLVKGKDLVRPQNLRDYQDYSEMILTLARCYIAARQFKMAYSAAKDLYSLIRQERDERALSSIVQSVNLIKQLLEFNQEHESYYKFLESDFSKIIVGFTEYPALMHAAIKMIAIPYLKNVVLSNTKNRSKILTLIDKISEIPQPYNSCLAYLKAKIIQGLFPQVYLHCLKDIDLVIEEIEKNQMLERWISFNKLANQSLLEKISASQIYRGFEFLANLTALFHLLGQEAHRELFLMEK